MRILESGCEGGDVSEAKVLVIIVTYNKKEYVGNLLTSLLQIDYKNYDVVVVDNASTDGTVEHLTAHFPGVKLIRNNENTGGSGGFNTGLNYAFGMDDYPYYWLLDNDVEVSKEALTELVRVLDEHRDIAVAGSQMCQLDNPEVTNEIGAYVDLHNGGLILNRHLTRRRNNSTGIFYVDYVAAASMLVRADIAKKAGLWEDFFIHFDDVDWCLRIKEMGHKVAGVADSVIWHLSAAEKPITWQQYYDVRNMLFLLDKHAGTKAVARFGRRKCLQALYTELRGMTPLAEIILDAIDDFHSDRKGKKTFHFPEHIDDAVLKSNHPAERVFICQNEWTDLRQFPLENEQFASIKEIMTPPYLIDAINYWHNTNPQLLFHFNRIMRALLLIMGLLGYRRYTRAYVDIRNMPLMASFLTDELVVRINEMNWVIRRDRSSVWKNLLRISRRSIKHYVRFSI